MFCFVSYFLIRTQFAFQSEIVIHVFCFTLQVFDAYLSNLANCVNRDMIDKAAMDFCLDLNNRPNRKKLTNFLFSVHRNRQDLIPFYSRLVATLAPIAPDIGNGLATLLKREFRWLVCKKDQMKIESKLKVCRFIGELVKFKVRSLFKEDYETKQ